MTIYIYISIYWVINHRNVEPGRSWWETSSLPSEALLPELLEKTT